MDEFELIGEIQDTLDSLRETVNSGNVSMLITVCVMDDGSMEYNVSGNPDSFRAIGALEIVKQYLLQEGVESIDKD